MKRNTIYAVLVTLALVFSACGSNSKEDGTGGDDNATGTTPSGQITTSLQSISIDKSNGNISLEATLTSNYSSDVIALLDGLSVNLNDCSLDTDSLSVNPQSVELTTDSPSSNVIFSAVLSDPNCVPTSYRVTGSTSLGADGNITSENYQSEIIAIDSNEIDFQAIDYSLIITNPTSKVLDINTSSSEHAIVLNLQRDTNFIAGQTIQINSLPTYGTFFTSSVVTNEDGNAVFAYTAPETISDSSSDLTFCMVEDSMVCDTLTINLTTGAVDTNDTNETDVGNDFINYGMTFTTSDGGNTLGLDERKAYVVSLINKDTNELIAASQVKKITIESKKPDVITLIDPSDAIGAAVTKLEIIDKSSINLFLKASEDTSGLADIEITIDYVNEKGFPRQLISTYAITVFSGPPTAFSINSAGVSYNFEEKWFENKFLISASDKYNNAINTSPTISVSVMAGYAKDSDGNKIVYGQYSKDIFGIYGDLSVSGNQGTLTTIGVAPFTDFDNVSLRGVDLDRDIVALFGNVRTYEANGKWEINSLEGTSSMSLKDIYEGVSYSGMGFAVGHNYREDPCSSDFREWEVKVDSTDGSYQLDNEGKAFVTVKFPAEYMPGKQVALMVNFVGENPETGQQLRAGEVKFKTLRSFEGLIGHSESVPADTPPYRVSFLMSTDTGTEDVWSYRNGRFTCDIKTTGGPISYTEVDRFYGTNKDNQCWFDSDGFRTGRAYITYELAGGAEDGTFELENCRVLDEFIY